MISYWGHASVIIVMYFDCVSEEQGKKHETLNEKRIAWGTSENNEDDAASQMRHEGG